MLVTLVSFSKSTHTDFFRRPFLLISLTSLLLPSTEVINLEFYLFAYSAVRSRLPKAETKNQTLINNFTAGTIGGTVGTILNVSVFFVSLGLVTTSLFNI
jgi:hypothetical protein